MARPDLLRYCPAGARLVDTAPLTLDDIEAECVAAHAAGQDVARLQSGDLSVFSAVAEQIRRLERRGIPYTLTPGVPAFAAAAALLGRELTVPAVAQSVILTRMPGRASQIPATAHFTIRAIAVAFGEKENREQARTPCGRRALRRGRRPQLRARSQCPRARALPSALLWV